MYFNRIKKYVETLSYHAQVDTLIIKKALNVDKNNKSFTNFAYLALERLVKLGVIEKHIKTSKRNIYRVIKKMDKCKITVLKGCRSDSGLITPILKRLKEDMIENEFFGRIDEVNLIPSDYMGSYAKMDWYLKHNTPDLVIVPADRIEMMAAATCCFLYGIPIAHIYGGITNYPLSTVDDTFRHNISLMSDIVFVENDAASRTVDYLRTNIGKHKIWIKTIGNLYMCDYEVDESTVDEPFCIVLYNGYKGSDNLGDKQKIIKNITTKRVVVISGNPDSSFTPKFDLHHIVTYNENLPRSIFLGLLKHCDRFITNSSSAYYEAPTFLKPEQIILIGDRNKARSSLNLPEGNPDLVIETIKNWFGERK